MRVNLTRVVVDMCIWQNPAREPPGRRCDDITAEDQPGRPVASRSQITNRGRCCCRRERTTSGLSFSRAVECHTKHVLVTHEGAHVPIVRKCSSPGGRQRLSLGSPGNRGSRRAKHSHAGAPCPGLKARRSSRDSGGSSLLKLAPSNVPASNGEAEGVTDARVAAPAAVAYVHEHSPAL